MLAATLTTAVVFFPVTFLYGVSQFLFSALALSVVLSLFASYFVAMTVVPLFCAKLIKGHQAHGERKKPHEPQRAGARASMSGSTANFRRMLDRYEGMLSIALLRPLATVLGIIGHFRCSACRFIPLIGKVLLPAHRSQASLSSTSRRPQARGWN